MAPRYSGPAPRLLSGAETELSVVEPKLFSTGTTQVGIRPTVGTSPPDPAEEDWLRRARLGDQDAVARLVERYSKKVFHLAMRMLGEDRETAADVTQEVFLRAFRALNDFAGDCRFSTWLHQITTNVCVSELRKRRALKRRTPTLSLDAPLAGYGDDALTLDPADARKSAEEQVSDRELYIHLRAAIEELPEDMRTVVQLRDLQGRSYEEIAEAIRAPVGTVRSRLHRARELLKERMGRHLG
jgi:RNA polymerase sigma-70 factor (ECF subfamily)